IETPATWDDFDAIRWYLAHGQTVVYVDKKVWHLLVLTKCQYLRPDQKCGIYLNRPKICREYTTDECEYDDDWLFDKVFEAPEQLWEYAEALLPPRRPKRGADASHLPVFTIGNSPSSVHGHGPIGPG
ncbi:MAG: YkgJ family cysteine cluster protein, partial [Isosphaeraceae bacterium]